VKHLAEKIFVAALALSGFGFFAPQPLSAQPEVKFSGFVLLNAQYNEGNAANPEIVTAALAGEKGSFLITPRQSRFVVSVSSKEVRWSPTAKIEMDFWGLHSGSGPAGVTQTTPRLRLAYFEIQPGAAVKLSFGQNWIVFAPLNPASLAHQSIPANTTAGNLWARLPMLRLDVKKQKLDFSFALNRPYGADLSGPTGQSDLLGAGEHSQLPFAQARLTATFGKNILGVSGHYGKLDFRRNGASKVNSQALAGDFKLAWKKFSLMGEGFLAKNVGTLFSNIKATAQETGITEMEGKGGWGQVGLEASERVSLHAGLGTENRDNDTANTQLFANLMVKPDKPLTFALEVGHTTTKGATIKAKNLGVNLGCQYSF